MARTIFALILFFHTVTHKAACNTLSNAFLKSMKTWKNSADFEGKFHLGF